MIPVCSLAVSQRGRSGEVSFSFCGQITSGGKGGEIELFWERYAADVFESSAIWLINRARKVEAEGSRWVGDHGVFGGTGWWRRDKSYTRL